MSTFKPKKYIKTFSLKENLCDRDILSLFPSNDEFELAERNPERLIEYEKTNFLFLKSETYFQAKILKYYHKKLYFTLSKEFVVRILDNFFETILKFLFPNYSTILQSADVLLESEVFPDVKITCNYKKEIIIIINRKRKKLRESIKQANSFLLQHISPSTLNLSSEPYPEAITELLIRSLVVMVKEYGMVNLIKMSPQYFCEAFELIATSDIAEKFLIDRLINELETKLSITPFGSDKLHKYSLEDLKYIFGFNKKKTEQKSRKSRPRKHLRSLEPGTFVEKPLFKNSNLEPAALGYVVRGALEALLNVDKWQLDERGRYWFVQTFTNGNCLKFTFNNFEPETNFNFDNDLVSDILLNNRSDFWVDVAKVHLVFAAYVTTNKQSYLHPLHINASDIVSYLGWDKRNDINQLEKLEYLYEIFEILGKLKVLFAWNCSKDSYVCSPHPVWRTFIYFEREQDDFGEYKYPEYVVIKLESGIWTEVFLNSTNVKTAKALCQWGYLPLDILQINSYHNNFEARLALYLVSNICIHPNKRPYKVESLLVKIGFEINSGRSKEKFIKALKLLKSLGWKVDSIKLKNDWFSQTISIERSELYPTKSELEFRRAAPKRIPQPFQYRWEIKYGQNGEIEEYTKFDPLPPSPGDIKQGSTVVLFFGRSYSPLTHADWKTAKYCFVEIEALKEQKSLPILRPVMGKQLKAARKQRKNTQAYIASCLGMSSARYSRIENGKRELTNEELERIFELFTEEELFADDKLLLPTWSLLSDS